MDLFNQQELQQLRSNGRVQWERQEAGLPEIDFPPVVKLVTPDAACTWLLSELDPREPDLAFGLFDLGLGLPELGSVSLTQKREVRGALRLPVERDGRFVPTKTLSEYAEDARRERRIVA